MIKCPKCEADNQIGAIFCRGCGEKLELDDLRPETVKDAAKQARETTFNWFAWIKNIIMLGILAGLVLGFVGLFMEPNTLNPSEFSDNDLKTAKAKLTSFQRGSKVTFDENEVNALVEDWFDLGEDDMEKYLKEVEERGESGNMITRSIQVELLGDDRVRLTMFQKHGEKDFIKYYSVMEGELSVAENGGLTIEPDVFAQGKVPFHHAAFLKKKITARLEEQYLQIQPFTDFISAVKTVEVKEGKLIVTGKPKPGDMPVKKVKATGNRRRRRN